MKVKETIKEKPITSKKLSTKVKANIKEKPITSKKNCCRRKLKQISELWETFPEEAADCQSISTRHFFQNLK